MFNTAGEDKKKRNRRVKIKHELAVLAKAVTSDRRRSVKVTPAAAAAAMGSGGTTGSAGSALAFASGNGVSSSNSLQAAKQRGISPDKAVSSAMNTINLNNTPAITATGNNNNNSNIAAAATAAAVIPQTSVAALRAPEFQPRQAQQHMVVNDSEAVAATAVAVANSPIVNTTGISDASAGLTWPHKDQAVVLRHGDITRADVPIHRIALAAIRDDASQLKIT